MAFLTINGLTVPVTAVKEVPRRLPATARRYLGGALCQETAHKRTWQVKTRFMSGDDLAALEQMILGRGYAWDFDGSLWTTKGDFPDLGRQASIIPAFAADGMMVSVEAGGVQCVGPGAAQFCPATVNILNSNLRTASLGFAVFNGSAVATSTDYKWQGTNCQRVVTSATINGTKGGIINSTTVTATATSATWRASAWVMSPTTTTLEMLLRNNTTATSGAASTVSLNPYEWQRIQCLGPAITIGDDLTIRITEDVADSGITFYTDAWQLEDQANGVTAWIDGTRGNGADALSGTLDVAGWDVVTINAWLYPSPNLDAIAVDLRKADGDTQVQIGMHPSTVDGIRATITTSPLESPVEFLDPTFFADDNHMVTLIVRRYGSTQLYKNGVLFGDTGDDQPAALAFERMNIWSIGGGSDPVATDLWWGQDAGFGSIMDVQILPYAPTEEQLEAWVDDGLETQIVAELAATYSKALLPKVEVRGDMIPEDRLRCHARLTGSSYRGYNAAGVWVPSARELTFELEEI